MQEWFEQEIDAEGRRNRRFRDAEQRLLDTVSDGDATVRRHYERVLRWHRYLSSLVLTTTILWALLFIFGRAGAVSRMLTPVNRVVVAAVCYYLVDLTIRFVVYAVVLWWIRRSTERRRFRASRED